MLKVAHVELKWKHLRISVRHYLRIFVAVTILEKKKSLSFHLNKFKKSRLNINGRNKQLLKQISLLENNRKMKKINSVNKL